MYKAVIFDLDGTLLDTISDLANSGNYVLKKLDLPQHSVDDYKKMVGHGVPNLVEQMLTPTARGGATQQMALQMFVNNYSMHSADTTAPYEGIPLLLAALKKANIKLGVLSNKEDTITNRVVNTYFPDTFDMVYGHVPNMPLKPNPAQLLTMCTMFGCDVSEVLYVGDSDVDALTAANANVLCCGVLWGYRTRQELKAAGCNLFAETQKELFDIIMG